MKRKMPRGNNKTPASGDALVGGSRGREAVVEERGASTTLLQSTVDSIRSLILRRELLPGEQLRQADLADRLQISRIPVREALSTLVAEHLVTYHPQKGWFVKRLNAEEFRQLRYMRGLLEDAALKEMNWPDDYALEQLRALDAEHNKAGVAGDFDRVRELNREFHARILGWSRLHVLVAEIERLRKFSDLYRWLYVWTPKALKRSQADHRAIIAALKARDAKALIAIRDAHSQPFDIEVMTRLSGAGTG